MSWEMGKWEGGGLAKEKRKNKRGKGEVLAGGGEEEERVRKPIPGAKTKIQSRGP